ncbi:HEPN domain-containing protein [Limnoglobus roseus]|uniref:Uncharacterized protein n=1 Tax=Limnoglobus roseus TaxID=2598579 RepID=A0A5C1ACQ8_9BACT|nr:HEPN domain-containing protein [Limnoglobus roseus]QEL14828.1 hypothetical protein PX52LOC_01726 [Limnoglobus roseus]
MDDTDLYGGLAGAPLPVERFDLGRGITLSATYAHLMAPFMMAFKRPERGQPHPGPWRAASGGFGFDILGQIHVPAGFTVPNWFDRLNTVWWFVALMRFRASPYIVVPVVADGPFSADGSEGVRFLPMEVESKLLLLEKDAPREIRVEDLEWVKENWWDAGRLMHESEEFNLLFQACAQCVFTRNPALALLQLWGSLEGMFSPAKTELKFRVSANISCFLEASGQARLELQKRIGKLYDARSMAAHGASKISPNALGDTYALVKRIITAIIETSKVPSRDDLEAAMFGS